MSVRQRGTSHGSKRCLVRPNSRELEGQIPDCWAPEVEIGFVSPDTKGLQQGETQAVWRSAVLSGKALAHLLDEWELSVHHLAIRQTIRQRFGRVLVSAAPRVGVSRSWGQWSPLPHSEQEGGLTFDTASAPQVLGQRLERCGGCAQFIIENQTRGKRVRACAASQHAVCVPRFQDKQPVSPRNLQSSANPPTYATAR